MLTHSAFCKLARRLRFPDTKNRPILNPLWVSVEMTGTLTHEGL